MAFGRVATAMAPTTVSPMRSGRVVCVASTRTATLRVAESTVPATSATRPSPSDSPPERCPALSATGTPGRTRAASVGVTWSSTSSAEGSATSTSVWLGSAVAPAAAQSRYYDYGPRYNVQRRDDLATRADRIRADARRMMDNGNLSRDHYDRTMAKLDRVYNDVNNRSRVRDDRYDADKRYLDDVEDTLNKWRDADARNERGRYYRHRWDR